jgi:subtilisin-like proprotein convertase family protein
MLMRISRGRIATGCVVTLVALATAGIAGAGIHYTNTGVITINTAGGPPGLSSITNATPYPSPISVVGLTGSITDVNVTLFGFTHTFTHDVDVLLAGPGNAQKTILMADSGQTASNVDLTFDDEASGSLPNGGALATGSYKPSTNLPGSCPFPPNFPSSAPVGPYAVSLTAFDGIPPSGTWNLYVVDDCSTESGSFAGGWSLEITTTTTAVTVSSMSARTAQRGVLVRWRTGTEVDLLGFQVYRSRDHAWRRVTHSQIRAKGSVAGASYRYLDRTAKRGVPYRYRIKAVSRDGTASWFGPVRVT